MMLNKFFSSITALLGARHDRYQLPSGLCTTDVRERDSLNRSPGNHSVTLIPIPLDTTFVRTKRLMHQDAVEAVDYDVDKITHVRIETTKHDAGLVLGSQKAASDFVSERGLYSKFTEVALDVSAARYIERMGANGY